jgi:hypothetical protein
VTLGGKSGLEETEGRENVEKKRREKEGFKEQGRERGGKKKKTKK